MWGFSGYWDRAAFSTCLISTIDGMGSVICPFGPCIPKVSTSLPLRHHATPGLRWLTCCLGKVQMHETHKMRVRIVLGFDAHLNLQQIAGKFH